MIGEFARSQNGNRLEEIPRNAAMILYHFTDCLDTGTILTEGLKPGNNGNKQASLSLPPIDVVWLSTGGLECWAIKAPLAMIELVIPSRDRKLVHWGKWVRRHAPDIAERLMNCDCGRDHRPSFKEHYCYFGVIPPSAFRRVYRIKVLGDREIAYEPDFTVLPGPPIAPPTVGEPGRAPLDNRRFGLGAARVPCELRPYAA